LCAARRKRAVEFGDVGKREARQHPCRCDFADGEQAIISAGNLGQSAMRPSPLHAAAIATSVRMGAAAPGAPESQRTRVAIKEAVRWDHGIAHHPSTSRRRRRRHLMQPQVLGV